MSAPITYKRIAHLLLNDNIIARTDCSLVYRISWEGEWLVVKRVFGNDDTAFERELDTASLGSPYLVRLVAALPDARILITEYMDKGDLKARIDSSHPLPVGFVQSVGIDVLAGLDFLHHIQPNPIIHRDLKPGNILLWQEPSGRWRAKLADFGSSRPVVRGPMTIAVGSEPCEGAMQRTRRLTRNIIDTAPEIGSGDWYDESADMYSFSFVLYEMLYGKTFWTMQRPGIVSKLAAADHRPPLPDVDQCDRCSLNGLIRSCWSRTAENRPTARRALQILGQAPASHLPAMHPNGQGTASLAEWNSLRHFMQKRNILATLLTAPPRRTTLASVKLGMRNSHPLTCARSCLMYHVCGHVLLSCDCYGDLDWYVARFDRLVEHAVEGGTEAHAHHVDREFVDSLMAGQVSCFLCNESS